MKTWIVYTNGGSCWDFIQVKNRKDALKEAKYNGCKDVRLVK